MVFNIKSKSLMDPLVGLISISSRRNVPAVSIFRHMLSSSTSTTDKSLTQVSPIFPAVKKTVGSDGKQQRISLDNLLFECGVHFGHSTKDWNPRVRPYLYGVRHGRHIFDLRKTVRLLQRATRFLTDVYKNEGRIMVVGYRPDVAKLIQPMIPQNPLVSFVGNKWVGGTLTNWNSLMFYCKNIVEDAWSKVNPNDLDFTTMEPAKEQLLFILHQHLVNTMPASKSKRFFRNFAPFVDVLFWKYILEVQNQRPSHFGKPLLFNKVELYDRPSALLLLHGSDSLTALNEAWIQDIPVVSIVDSDFAGDLGKVSYVIPGNDDNLKAQYLYARTLLYNMENYKSKQLGRTSSNKKSGLMFSEADFKDEETEAIPQKED